MILTSDDRTTLCIVHEWQRHGSVPKNLRFWDNLTHPENPRLPILPLSAQHRYFEQQRPLFISPTAQNNANPILYTSENHVFTTLGFPSTAHKR